VYTYELSMVTYGIVSASYLATRCLNHLAEQYSSKYLLGSVHVKRNFYVDNLLTRADGLREVRQICDIQLLQLGKFELCKSNYPQLLKDLYQREDALMIGDSEAHLSILGIRWNQSEDLFCFLCNSDSSGNAITKRTTLSEAARLFDLLGILGPIIVLDFVRAEFGGGNKWRMTAM